MNKAVLSLVIAGVVGAGYLGAVKFTGDRAHQATLNMLAEMESSPNYRELVELQVSSEKGFFGSRYEITMNVILPDLKQPMLDVVGSSAIPIETTSSYGVFTADYRSVLAEGDLLSKLKGVQKNARQEPFLDDTRISINPLNGQATISSHTRLDELRINENNKLFEMAASESRSSLENNQYDTKATIGSIRLADVDADVFRFDGMKLNQTAQLLEGSSFFDGLYQSIDADIDIGALEGNSRNGSQLSMQPSRVSVKQMTEAGRVKLSMAYDLGATQVISGTKGEVLNLKTAGLDFTLDLDNDAYHKVTRQINEMGVAQTQNPFLMLGLLSTVTEKGINLGVQRLNVELQQGQFNADGHLEVAGFNMQQTLQNPDIMRENVKGLLNIELDEALVEMLPDSGEKRQLEAFIQQGFVTRKANQLTSRLEVEDGKLVVNGIPLGNI